MEINDKILKNMDKKNQLALVAINPDNKAKKIKKKNKKKKKKKLNYEKIIAKSNIIKNIHERIDKSDFIPEPLKRKYKNIETDPLKLIMDNLVIGVKPVEYLEFFNVLLTSLDDKYENSGKMPIYDCFIGETKRFGILDFNDLEAVWKILKLSPIIFKDSKIFFRRPKGFFTKHYEGKKYELDKNGNLINLEAGNEFKLYISNLPQYMNEIQTKKLVESFGQLKDFQMKKEFSAGEKISKGYCIVEYFSNKDGENALKNLQNLKIGDKNLVLKKIETQKKIFKNKNAPTKEMETSFLLMFPKIRDKLVQAMLSIPKSAVEPTKNIQLLNMCSPEDLFDIEFVEELEEDVLDKCKNYGPVDKIVINTPERDGFCNNRVGKVFVKFHDLRHAKQARYNINGMTYNNRTVIVSFLKDFC